MAISRGRDQKTPKNGTSKYSGDISPPEHSRVLTWANFNPFRLKLLVGAVTACGDAVTFGSTRQGGLSLTVLEDDFRHREYSNDIDDMEDKVRVITDAALAAVPQQVRDKIIELCKEI